MEEQRLKTLKGREGEGRQKNDEYNIQENKSIL